MTGFLDAAKQLLSTDTQASEVRLYFYAVTAAGWLELSSSAATWKARSASRTLVAYVGTDHALTDGAALEAMRTAGVSVRLLRRYNGVYHPKVVWFHDAGRGHLLVGSNNLTFDGLRSNIEFATLTRLTSTDQQLADWHNAVHSASDVLTDALLDSYKKEKQSFGKARAKARVASTFTWTKRSGAGASPAAAVPTGATPSVPAAPAAPAPPTASAPPPAGSTAAAPLALQRGDLIVEIMPLETGVGGSQIQIPMAAASTFFGLGAATGAHRTLSLTNRASGSSRTLTMTRFANSTARLVLRDLDYRDRPCIVVFRKVSASSFEFEILQQSIHPTLYRTAIGACGVPTRGGSRRWVIMP